MVSAEVRHLLFPLFVGFLMVFIKSSQADVGTSAHYDAPYLPTVCFGEDASQFPANMLFASAGEGIWDNGASCGREYLVRCLSGSDLGTCIEGQTIQIRIVDRAISSYSQPSIDGTTMVLSHDTFSMIANPSATEINIEFQQV